VLVVESYIRTSSPYKSKAGCGLQRQEWGGLREYVREYGLGMALALALASNTSEYKR